MAPHTTERTTFEKECCPYAGPIVDGKAFDVENQTHNGAYFAAKVRNKREKLKAKSEKIAAAMKVESEKLEMESEKLCFFCGWLPFNPYLCTLDRCR